MLLLCLLLVSLQPASAGTFCPQSVGSPTYLADGSGTWQQLYVRDAQQRLLEWTWSLQQGWSVQNLSQDAENLILSAPSVSSEGAVFAQSVEQRLNHWWWDNSLGWQTARLSEQLISAAPEYVSDDIARHLFAVNPQGELVEWWQLQTMAADAAWQQEMLSSGQDLLGRASYSQHADTQHVFVRDAQQQLWEWWWQAERGWQQINLTALTGQKIAGDPSAVYRQGQQHVFAPNPQSQLVEWYWSAQDGWQITPISEQAGGSLVGKPSYLALDAQHSLVGRDDAGQLLHWQWQADTGWRLENLSALFSGQRISSDPIQALNAGVQHVFATDDSAQLWEWWRPLGGTWQREHVNLAADPGCQIGDDTQQQNQFVYQQLQDAYYWYAQVPSLNPQDYASPAGLLAAAKYAERDKWSYITSQSAYQQFYNEGTTIGLGLGLAVDVNGELRISYVYEDSPAFYAGLERGDWLLAVNGEDVYALLEQDRWEEAWGQNELGVAVTLDVRKLSSNSQQQLQMYKNSVAFQPLNISLLSTRINQTAVAYLAFNQFTTRTRQQLQQAFEFFQAKQAKELIIDLRYNSGGRLSVARDLASLIVGSAQAGKVFEQLIHNDKYQAQDQLVLLNAQEHSLNLSRVVILSSLETCSASESLINDLRPYIEVIQIGDSSCGKPVGSQAYAFHDQVLNLITVSGVNKNGEGDYFAGLTPNCYAQDDFLHNLGDVAENVLSTALAYLREQECPGSSAALLRDAKEQASLSQKPYQLPRDSFRREIGSY